MWGSRARIEASSSLRRVADRSILETMGSGLNREKALEFRQLLQEECGIDLTLEETWARATQLVALYRMLMGPIPEDPEVRTCVHLPSEPVDTAAVVK